MKKPRALFQIITYSAAVLMAVSCEKSEVPAKEIPEPTQEAEAEISIAPPVANDEAQRKLEAMPYYTEENIATANAVIEKLTPETRGNILEFMREGKKIEAVKLAREAQKTSLAVSKLAVEMLSIAAEVDPGLQ
ncbi:hypothetical protein [Luteolibacter sp. AS25]|uniref:hypothetical protein n=1 Tax=Luteolibacter sp. AS25 TaxID=3135776 RepID=UPI00398A6FFD